VLNTKIDKNFFADFINYSKNILQELKEEYVDKNIILEIIK